MEPSILPVSSLGPAILAALQAQSGDAQIQTLLALVGENLDLLLLSTDGNSAKLQMPGGSVFEAAGELPYPPGTRLTVQVQPPVPDQLAPRLKLVEALPPPPSPILAPLQQGEAAQLRSRLRAPDLPPEMAALARLFTELGGDSRESPSAPPATPAKVPSSGRILAFLEDLPAAALQDLRRVLMPKAAALPALTELADALRVLLLTSEPGPSAPPAKPAQTDQAPMQAASPPAPRQGVLPGLTVELLVSSDPYSVPARPGFPQGTPEASALLLPAASEAPPGSAPKPSTGEKVPLKESSTAAPAAVPLTAMPLLVALPSPFPVPPDPALEPLKDLLLMLLRPFGTEPDSGPTLADLLARATGEAAGTNGSRKVPVTVNPAADPSAASPMPPAPGPVSAGIPKPQPASAKTGEVDKAPESPQQRPVRAVSGELSAATKAALDPGSAAGLGRIESPAAATKAWETWMSSSVKALSDPQVSPREAPFHLAQAKEGTAFFELPLPWEGPGKVLQLWVEADGGGNTTRGSLDRTLRVLVGIHFSTLGETRVGIIRSGERLQVRVWAEHADLLRDREASIKAELKDLGPGLDFQVLPLGEPGEAFPSLRSLASGTAYHALG